MTPSFPKNPLARISSGDMRERACAIMPGLLLGFVISVFLGGCAIGPGTPAPDKYLLTPGSGPESGPASGNVSDDSAAAPGATHRTLSIQPVRMAPMLDNDRIAVIREGRIVDHYAGARWAAPLDELVRRFLEQSFENRFGPVVLRQGESRLPPSYTLAITIHDFQAEYDKETSLPPVVKIGMIVSLNMKDDGKPKMIRRRIEKTQTATENTMAAVHQTFQEMLRNISSEMADRILAQHIVVRPD